MTERSTHREGMSEPTNYPKKRGGPIPSFFLAQKLSLPKCGRGIGLMFAKVIIRGPGKSRG